MQRQNSTASKRFRSVLDVKRAYLPSLLKSQSRDDGQEMIERTEEMTKHTLRKCVKA